MFPEATFLRLEACDVDDTTAPSPLRGQSMQPRAPWPLGAPPARRIHSDYGRPLADLPWAQSRVGLQLRVRQWVGGNRACPRRIFTARLPPVAAPWARRTLRLAQRRVALGVALGGTAGGHLRHQWAWVVSRHTLLRLRRRQPALAFPTPRVLGADDCALRKRQPYGTIRVELDRRQPVALLPDRASDTCAQWLQAHPGVEVSTRDRAQAYAAGARQGAPQALQVADRVHLGQTLAETLPPLFKRHSAACQGVKAAMAQPPPLRPAAPVGVPVPPSPPPRPAQLQAAHRRSRRLARPAQIGALRRQGWTGQAMAHPRPLATSTVWRSLRSPTCAERTYKRRGPSMLPPDKDRVLQRWNRGGHDALQGWHRLQQQGYQGSDPPVARYAQRLRQAQGLKPRQRTPAQPLPRVAKPPPGPRTPRGTAWLVLRRPETREPDEEQPLAQLTVQQAELAEAVTLARELTDLLRTRQPDCLESWLEGARTSAVAALRRFAQGLRDDDAASKAGGTVPWRNGPVEGHIHRLKMRKCPMFGRAHLDLLGHRFLRPPRERVAQAGGPREQEPTPAPAQAA